MSQSTPTATLYSFEFGGKVLYTASFVKALATDGVKRYSIRDSIEISKSPLSNTTSPLSLEYDRVNPSSALFTDSRSLAARVGNKQQRHPNTTNPRSNAAVDTRRGGRNAAGNDSRRQGQPKVAAPVNVISSREQEPPSASDVGFAMPTVEPGERRNFDMEAFKLEMKRRENPDFAVADTAAYFPPSAAKSEAVTISEQETVFSDRVTSRFGGRFFKLEEDDVPTVSAPISLPSSSPPANDNVINLLSLLRVESSSSEQAATETQTAAVPPSVKQATAPPKPAQKIARNSFDSRVPTSVLRKMQTPVKVAPPPTVAPQASTPQTIQHAQAMFVAPQQQPYQQQPRYPELPPDIPPPHIFLQMLVANNLPVPPELQKLVNDMQQLQPPPNQQGPK